MVPEGDTSFTVTGTEKADRSLLQRMSLDAFAKAPVLFSEPNRFLPGAKHS